MTVMGRILVLPPQRFVCMEILFGINELGNIPMTICYHQKKEPVRHSQTNITINRNRTQSSKVEHTTRQSVGSKVWGKQVFLLLEQQTSFFCIMEKTENEQTKPCIINGDIFFYRFDTSRHKTKRWKVRRKLKKRDLEIDRCVSLVSSQRDTAHLFLWLSDRRRERKGGERMTREGRREGRSFPQEEGGRRGQVKRELWVHFIGTLTLLWDASVTARHACIRCMCWLHVSCAACAIGCN